MAQTLIRLYQLSDGYCYNSDSLFLYDFAKPFLKHHFKVLDVGCGSGILGKLCIRDFQIQLSMIELDPLMAFLASINVPQAKIYTGDFLSFQCEEKFDLILSNPPFYRSGILPSQNTRLNHARNEKSLPFDLALNRIKRLLKPNGAFVFCYDAKESHRIFHTLKSQGFNAEVARFVYPKIDKNASLVLLKAKIQSKSSLKILPPLITHIGEKQTDNSEEVRRIYQECNTYSIKVASNEIILPYSPQ